MNYLRIFFLSPLAIIYKIITSIRNVLFDFKLIPTFYPKVFTVGIGNLTVGGTGKTPMTDFLISKLGFNNIAVLSRGYGRATRGFIEINNSKTAKDVGDEPLMLYNLNKKQAKFFVSEGRVLGYKKVIKKYPKTNFLILDDVYQHRYILPQLQILLCDFNQPFFNDYVLPSGNLRESRNSANRADLIIVTKCPLSLSDNDRYLFIKNIGKYSSKPIFFSFFINNPPQNIKNKVLDLNSKAIVISGLANNHYFSDSISKNFEVIKTYSFNDHHTYLKSEIEGILNKNPNIPIVTTKKDYVKIENIISLKKLKLFYVVKTKVKMEDEEAFMDFIFDKYNKLKSI